MSTEHSPLDTQVEQPTRGSLIATDERREKPVVSQRQVCALMAYYVALLIASITLILFLIWWEGVPLDIPNGVGTPSVGTPEARRRVLATMAFLVSGAVVGSVLYHTRMLFRFYIKANAFDSRWLVKYVSAPAEAAGLALAIVSILESGAVALGGPGFHFSQGKPFAAFGVGALVGFGIREVIGWLGTVTKTVFPTDLKTDEMELRSSERKKP